MLAEIDKEWEHESNRSKLERWYWNGVFGELYGSAVESRIARDFIEVPAWLDRGPEPSTVSETLFRADPTENDANASLCCLQGRECALNERGRNGLTIGTTF